MLSLPFSVGRPWKAWNASSTIRSLAVIASTKWSCHGQEAQTAAGLCPASGWARVSLACSACKCPNKSARLRIRTIILETPAVQKDGGWELPELWSIVSANTPSSFPSVVSSDDGTFGPDGFWQMSARTKSPGATGPGCRNEARSQRRRSRRKRQCL
ncbi:hypothetical protein B0J13DRAFT_563868 [Dactylonectria estremocensis]|uniref:Uncharacterized protein n=1 Tax=Dactylonectria estremocensis TaxID=1079267 RepID=A0A9P9E0V8_9HYPO|nr:hypothetical protein B0J13DRAFT_563868 [Dactylonectria estremocensis]